MNIKNKIQGKTPYVYAKMKKSSAYTIYGDICKSVFFPNKQLQYETI